MKWIAVVFLAMHSSAQAFDLIGTAKDLKSGAVLYIEKHRITKSEDGLNRLIQTEYQKPDGKVFARMRTDFKEDPFLPKIEFSDDRFAITETLIYDRSQKKITLTKREKDKADITKELKVSGNMVAGQGFTNFIKMNFDAPDKSKLKFNFVVLANADHYKFEVVVKDKASAEQKNFQLSPGNFLFRWLSQPIEVGFFTKTKSISTWKGLSNILSDDNRSQEVLIAYEEGRP
ncbi:MAG: hypothetical protein IPM97_07960 [Bdellovibrionaceae bacterium]|nr:hypothetical protein [Pseudobdellovibrionaceae bacterium]